MKIGKERSGMQKREMSGCVEGTSTGKEDREVVEVRGSETGRQSALERGCSEGRGGWR